MSRLTKQPIAALPTGSTRTIDYALNDSAAGAVIDATGLQNAVRNLRSGVVENAQLSISTCVWTFSQGRMMVAIKSGLNNGFAWLKGMTVTTQRPPIPGSLTLRGPRVTRFLVTQAAPFYIPNADVGTNILISSAGGISDLFTAIGTGPNKSGFGVQMIQNRWNFVNKWQGVGSGNFTEAVDLGLGAIGGLIDTEFRIYDATFQQEARLEVWVAGLLRLTRYWTNPLGVGTPLLPPLNTTLSGAQLFMQHRSTSTAPADVLIADSSIIQGTADSGTL